VLAQLLGVLGDTEHESSVPQSLVQLPLYSSS